MRLERSSIRVVVEVAVATAITMDPVDRARQTRRQGVPFDHNRTDVDVVDVVVVKHVFIFIFFFFVFLLLFIVVFRFFGWWCGGRSRGGGRRRRDVGQPFDAQIFGRLEQSGQLSVFDRHFALVHELEERLEFGEFRVFEDDDGMALVRVRDEERAEEAGTGREDHFVSSERTALGGQRHVDQRLVSEELGKDAQHVTTVIGPAQAVMILRRLIRRSCSRRTGARRLTRRRRRLIVFRFRRRRYVSCWRDYDFRTRHFFRLTYYHWRLAFLFNRPLIFFFFFFFLVYFRYRRLPQRLMVGFPPPSAVFTVGSSSGTGGGGDDDGATFSAAAAAIRAAVAAAAAAATTPAAAAPPPPAGIFLLCSFSQRRRRRIDNRHVAYARPGSRPSWSRSRLCGRLIRAAHAVPALAQVYLQKVTRQRNE